MHAYRITFLNATFLLAILSIIRVHVVAALPCFVVTIPRHLITSWDIEFGDNGVSPGNTGVLSTNSTDTSRMEVSMSSKFG